MAQASIRAARGAKVRIAKPRNPNAARPNQPPIAVLRVVSAHYVSDLVVVSTEGTTDPEGLPVTGTIEWGDDDTTAYDPSEYLYSHTYDAAGTYTASFTVRDNALAEAYASTTITVVVAEDPEEPPDDPEDEPDPPVPVSAVLTYISGQFSGQPYVFSTALSTVGSYSMDWGDATTADTGSVLPSTVTHTYVNAGTYIATLTVTNSQDAAATASRTVTIQSSVVANQAPICSVTLVSGFYTGNFTFALTAHDADGAIGSYSITHGDGTSSGTIAGSPPATYTHTYSTAHASRTLTLTVSDGSVATSSSVTFAVTARPTPPAGGTHAYFEALSAGPLSSTVMKAISLRATSGAHSPSDYYDITYAVPGASYVYGSGDTYHSPKDGTKISLPVFRPLSVDWTTAQLSAAITSTSTSCALNTLAGDFDRNNLHWMIDSEIIGTNAASGLSVPIIARGLFGTTATSHSIGAYVRPVRHSLFGQVHVPIVLADNYDHLFTFDIWFGPETTYALQGHSNAAAKSWRFEWPGVDMTVYLQGSHGAYKSTSPAIDCGPFEYLVGRPPELHQRADAG